MDRGWLFVSGCVVAAAALLCAVVTSCATLDSACAKAMPAIVATQGQLADVQRAIADVDASGVRDKLPAEQQARFDAAMKQIREGYAVAVQATSLAADACSTPDVRGALALIVDAWTVLRSVLALVGGTGTPTVADPLVWTEAAR